MTYCKLYPRRVKNGAGGSFRGKRVCQNVSIKGKTRRVCCKQYCRQCSYVIPSTGRRCKNQTCKHYKYCWIHLMSPKKLRVSTSGIPNAGDGLFAVDKASYYRDGRRIVPSNLVVFRNGEDIAYFGGEELDLIQLNERYPGENTGAYALRVNRNKYYDELCARTASAFSNDKPRTRGANCKLVNYRGELKLKATKNIKHGQEIFWPYGRSYWRGVNVPRRS